ncbi:MAG: hypothetical protein JW759_03685 [Candidatus Coatesbacteria bacterium]|nr:hypothetical protein [Candidatus Coatesbacteria bacterium]
MASARTMQMDVPLVKVMFEFDQYGNNKEIPLQFPEEQARQSGTEEVFFVDTFEAHQRHVYMIPREDFWGRQLPYIPAFPWGIPRAERLIVSRHV